MRSLKFTQPMAIATAVIVVGGGAFGIVNATSGGNSGTAASATVANAGHFGFKGGASNARSAPAAGGSIGKVSSVSASSFQLSTSGGQKVTIKETSSTTYENGTSSSSASAVTKGEPVLALGITDSTTITATQVIVQPTSTETAPSWAGKVVTFQRGAQGSSKSVGKIPASYQQGSGKLASGTTAAKATEAALSVYPGGVVDRVVELSDGGYEVHNIGVNWPHHIFVSKDFKVVGADD